MAPAAAGRLATRCSASTVGRQTGGAFQLEAVRCDAAANGRQKNELGTGHRGRRNREPPVAPTAAIDNSGPRSPSG